LNSLPVFKLSDRSSLVIFWHISPRGYCPVSAHLRAGDHRNCDR
jgi:hypothetical protein